MADIICSDSSESDLIDDFSTSDLKIGDAVAIETMTLFNNRKYMFEMLSYNIRYMCLEWLKKYQGSSFAYQVDWKIHGLFDISEDV